MKIASPNPSAVLDKTSKFLRVMKRAGVLWENYDIPINDTEARNNLAEFINRGCPKVNYGKNGKEGAWTESSDEYYIARTIMGGDFISPDEVEEARKVTYRNDILRNFVKTLPSKEKLEYFKSRNFVLMPGPPIPMSVWDIYVLNPELCPSVQYRFSGGEYKSVHDDKIKPRWLAIRKCVYYKTIGKTWEAQVAMKHPHEFYIPNAPEALWELTTYRETRGEWLMKEEYSMTTSTFCSKDQHISVGYTEGGKVNIICHDDMRNHSGGLAFAFKVENSFFKRFF